MATSGPSAACCIYFVVCNQSNPFCVLIIDFLFWPPFPTIKDLNSSSIIFFSFVIFCNTKRKRKKHHSETLYEAKIATLKKRNGRNGKEKETQKYENLIEK